MASIQFDVGMADVLKVDLNNCIGEVNASLDKMGAEVANIKDWWKGGSEDGYIEKFNKRKVDIQRILNQCADDYKQLVEKIKSVKQESEMSIKRYLGG